MNQGIAIQKCATCGAKYFPYRLLCANCGGRDFGVEHVENGVLEELTTVRRAANVSESIERRFASVRVTDAVRVVARLDDDVAPGTRVTVEQDGLLVRCRPTEVQS